MISTTEPDDFRSYAFARDYEQFTNCLPIYCHLADVAFLDLCVGAMVGFEVVNRCRDGLTFWTSIPSSTASRESPEKPAPGADWDLKEEGEVGLGVPSSGL